MAGKKTTLTYEEACECVEHTALEFEQMTYPELATLADAERKERNISDIRVNWQGVELRIEARITKFGWVWKRVAVELILVTSENATLARQGSLCVF